MKGNTKYIFIHKYFTLNVSQKYKSKNLYSMINVTFVLIKLIKGLYIIPLICGFFLLIKENTIFQG